jgi:hypothetical protein
MRLGAVLFLVAVLVTATAAVPVAAAIVVERQTRAALWLRSHARWIWATAALSWLASLVLDLVHGSPFAPFDFIASALGFACTVGLALLSRPATGHPNTLATASRQGP